MIEASKKTQTQQGGLSGPCPLLTRPVKPRGYGRLNKKVELKPDL